MSFSEKMLQSLSDGDLDGADLLLQQALTHDELPVLIELGEVLIEKGFLIEAKEVFLDLVERQLSEKDLVLTYLAEIAIEEDDYETAFEYLDQIKKTSEYYPRALFMMADAYQAIGFVEVSLAKLQELLALLPDDETVQFAYAEIALLANKLTLAQNMYELLLDAGYTEFSNVSILERLATTLAHQGKFEEALDYYKEAYRHKKNDQILLNLARLNQQMHEMDEAIVYYEELIKENPNIKEAYLELADIYVHEQQPVKAAQLLEQAIKENPYYVHFYLHLAEVLEELEDYQKANLYLNQALLLDEEEDSVLTALAKNAFYQGEYEQTLHYFERIENAYQGELLWMVARIYNEEEEFEKAAHYYEMALEEMQEVPEFIRDYCYFLRDEGRLKEALALLESHLAKEMHDESLHQLYDELKQNDWDY